MAWCTPAASPRATQFRSFEFFGPLSYLSTELSTSTHFPSLAMSKSMKGTPGGLLPSRMRRVGYRLQSSWAF
eukprot:58798-Pleurochrysis_carterae.AAC.2